MRQDKTTLLVANEIPASPDDPKIAQDIANALGLTRQQVLSAVARIKEDYPEQPLTSGSRGYLWSADAVDVKRHVRKEVRTTGTRVRRTLLEGAVEPYYKDGDESALEKARERTGHILGDLSNIDVHRVAED